MKEYFKKLYPQSKESFYSLVEKNLKQEKKMFIITANPETFMMGRDKEFAQILSSSFVTLIPDGISIVKSSKFLNIAVKERITGIDLTTELLFLANKYQAKVCLLGSKKEVLKKMQENIQNAYPNIKLGKCLDGYVLEEEMDKYMQSLVKEKPDIVLVALGIPRQEQLISKHYSKFSKGIFVGVGGTFDVLSGTKKRAPKVWQKLNLEWLYRIIKEPRRIGRFFKNNVLFVLKVFVLKFRKD